MKFLLVAINAKYIHSNLAVYSLKAYAEKYGNNKNKIEIAEYTINQQSGDILRDIYEKQPDAIGFSCYIWNIDIIKEVATNIKKINSNIDIWVGGPEASYDIEEFMKNNSSLDYIIYGEGEETFKQVMDSYDDFKNSSKNTNKNFVKINGISYRQNNEIIINSPQPILDLSMIPFVYKNMEDFENKIIYYESSRGCPFSCSYCLSSVDKKLRFRDIGLVKQELKFFIDQRTSQVKFVDRTFNCNKEHSLAIWKFIRDYDNGITNFHFEIAADLISEEEIELIKTTRPGLIQLEIGVQSTNKNTLDAINRKTDIEKIAKKTGLIKENGNIHQHLDLIAGLPYEDYESFKKSFNDVYSMEPDQLQLGFLKVLHGSIIKESAMKYEIVYSEKSPYEVLKTKWISFEEILQLKAVEAVVEIYYNSFQFVNTIKRLEIYFKNPFEMYEKLGLFYKEKTENGAKHSRVKQYILLKEFIESNVCEAKEDWVELLTLDYYYRENAKSRPIFAKNLDKYKNRFRVFYKSDIIREILPDYKDYDSKQIDSMTHIEVVGIDTEDEEYILFDYKNRNPLNHQAKAIYITEVINGKIC